MLFDCILKYPNAKPKIIMRYAKSRYLEHEREVSYRIYVTDSLKSIAENTQKFAGGTALKQRYYDVAYNVAAQKQAGKPKETGQQIIDRINKKLAAMNGGGNHG